jgi:hypothetical protein
MCNKANQAGSQTGGPMMQLFLAPAASGLRSCGEFRHHLYWSERMQQINMNEFTIINQGKKYESA